MNSSRLLAVSSLRTLRAFSLTPNDHSPTNSSASFAFSELQLPTQTTHIQVAASWSAGIVVALSTCLDELIPDELKTCLAFYGVCPFDKKITGAVEPCLHDLNNLKDLKDDTINQIRVLDSSNSIGPLIFISTENGNLYRLSSGPSSQINSQLILATVSSFDTTATLLLASATTNKLHLISPLTLTTLRVLSYPAQRSISVNTSSAILLSQTGEIARMNLNYAEKPVDPYHALWVDPETDQVCEGPERMDVFGGERMVEQAGLGSLCAGFLGQGGRYEVTGVADPRRDVVKGSLSEVNGASSEATQLAAGRLDVLILVAGKEGRENARLVSVASGTSVELPWTNISTTKVVGHSSSPLFVVSTSDPE